ncbi:glycosyltransferase [Sphingomonas sp. FW199]|uniref:glycosyltransferase n=1 Tax=Sphingomonas sp. FW199 TaxID=3400217 RepID=UPI003CE9773D
MDRQQGRREMTIPDISVIIPHYNDPVRLDRCLASLDQQSVDRSRFEIIVADNRSPVGEAVVAAAIAGRATLVFADEKGAGPARNAAVAASTGRILAFIDADCVADPDWLAAGEAALSRHDLVGGRMIVFTESGGRPTPAEAFELVFAFQNEAYVRDKGFSVTANLFTTRAVFDAVGPFRNGVSEDADWCHRARDLGYRIGYAADARVSHPARTDWPELERKFKRINAEMHQLLMGRPGGGWRWAAQCVILPLSIPAHAVRVLRAPTLNGVDERLAALGMLARIRMWRTTDALLRLVGART